MNVFLVEPAFVMDPVTLNVTPSPSTNPSPVISTLPFVNALPSYCLESVALVNVTSLFRMLYLISNDPL